MSALRLGFPVRDIPRWAERYPIEADEEVERIGPAARERGHLTRPEFLSLCRWKTPRTQPQCRSNDPSLIRGATRVALSTEDEELKILALTLLEGVGWPTASVILHFCARQPYPILDVRALWSLGCTKTPRPDFPFWFEWTAFSRDLAQKAGVSMRTLDRALWQYSRERQRAG